MENKTLENTGDDLLDDQTTDTSEVLETEPVVEAAKVVSEPVVDIPRVKQTSDINLTEEVKDKAYTFSLPSYTFDKFTVKIKNFNNTNIDTDANLKDWRDTVQESVEYYTAANLYNDRVKDPNSLFEQGIKDSNGNLSSINNFKLKQIDGEIKGELALLKIAKHLGLGDIIRVPLPHTGMWVTLKPPAEKDLIDFYNNLYRDKIILGRSTSGLTLSNFSVYINNSLLDFILEHVHSTNYSDIKISELKKYISIYDLPILAWGFACTIYPNGFDYERACIEDVEKCSNIVKAKINLSKLLWIDNNALTDAQRTILSEFRPNKLSLDNYNKFQAENVKLVNNYFITKTNLKFNLTSPTAVSYIEDGLTWVNSINNKIEQSLLLDKDEDSKQRLLEQYVKTSTLRQYGHFITSIEIDDNTIVDRETINSILELVSADDDIRQEVIEKINKYISDSTIGLIGIPEYECPACKANQNPDPVNDRFVNIISLDSMNLFFSLITLRVTTILGREL